LSRNEIRAGKVHHEISSMPNSLDSVCACAGVVVENRALFGTRSHSFACYERSRVVEHFRRAGTRIVAQNAI